MKIALHLDYFRLDPFGELFFLYDKVTKKILISFCSILTKFIFKIKRISYGKNLMVKGRLISYRFPCSKISIGSNCSFSSSSRFNYRGLSHKCILQTGQSNASIIIGNDCGFSGVSIVADKKVEIGNNVIIGANSSIADRDGHQDIYASPVLPVIIGNNVWIGMNVTILKGVTIGDNVIVGAGSIVTKDIPANSIAAGIPAKVIKQR